MTPFLSPEENGRLPSPYERIAKVTVLDRALAHFQVVAPSDLVEEFERIVEGDPMNPEFRFFLGEAWRRAENPAEAEKAYLQAWDLGRRDPITLALLCGVNAANDEARMLDPLIHLGAGFLACLSPVHLLMLVVGIVVGLLVGVLPGLTLVMGVILVALGFRLRRLDAEAAPTPR